MILSIIVLVLIGVIVYFHYLQGLFSAALSALFAVIAAVVAVSYHETVVDLLLAGKFADQAHAAALVALFAAVYIVLRVVFDQYVPGNVQFPLILDRIGAPVMGVIAGIFAVGVLMIAAQALPFGMVMLGYSRYPVAIDREVRIRVPGMNQIQDAVFDELDKSRFLRSGPGDSDNLLVPVDSLVLKLVYAVSGEDASLSNGRPFASIHPDYLQELFGQRTGLQVGSKRVASPKGSSVINLYTSAEFPQVDQERFEAENNGIGVRYKEVVKDDEKKLSPTRKPQPGHLFLVVRTQFASEDADPKTNVFAFSPASVRLVAQTKDGDQLKYKNYFPIGTLEAGSVLYVAAPDDYLFAANGKAADLVYEVEEEGLFAPGADPKAPREIVDGVFIEIKRMARVDLGGKTIGDIKKASAEETGSVEVMRKEGAAVQTNVGNGTGPAPAPSAKNSTLTVESGAARISNALFTAVNVGTDNTDVARGETDWGKFGLTNRKFSKLELDPVRSITMLGQGSTTVSEFHVPEGQKMVQVAAKPRISMEDKWAWASSLGDFQLIDAAGQTHLPAGAWAKLKNGQGQDMLVVRYSAQGGVTSVPDTADMRPTDVTVLFLVPVGTELKTLNFRDEVVLPLQLKVP